MVDFFGTYLHHFFFTVNYFCPRASNFRTKQKPKIKKIVIHENDRHVMITTLILCEYPLNSLKTAKKIG